MIDKYFQNSNDHKNIAVISVIPPYMFDYYKKSNYKLLPLSLYQPFMSTPEITWGKDDYSDLITLYKKYLHSGYILYVPSFTAKTSQSFSTVQRFVFDRDFNNLSQSFNLEKIAGGCEGGCSLYRVSGIDKQF
jgi:hypothetical protein